MGAYRLVKLSSASGDKTWTHGVIGRFPASGRKWRTGHRRGKPLIGGHAHNARALGTAGQQLDHGDTLMRAGQVGV
ncbi:hypothetical protein [Streptomyces sp. NBC_01446]|uniref:hypothetical protein n=1 Tax=Streptomyces sp. NBC_01446 TaxID=2903870 RepID=UPI002259D31F|nr:hypothetical protein [Streptomyces sp. NBC_01446]MCX4649330.1 hypothetical protein [Streptomyces sp. NBC_01446]